MGKKTVVPDAWDDDWETQADKITTTEQNQPDPEPEEPKTKSERLARHAETNRKLWESADSPETFHFLEANNTVPLTTTFKPQVKVLSRKPVIAKRDPTTGMSQMTLEDEDDEDSAAKKEAQPTSEEIKAKQRREREEKQRRYEEARAKIFGESATSSGASSPSGTTTPPRSDGQNTPRGRGRGRGGGVRGNNNNNHNNTSMSQSEPRQFDNRRQNNAGSSARGLYDPNYSAKPDSSQARTDSDGPVRISTPRNEQQQQAIREPRGPDGSGRGGFGFARRGAKEG